jgi:hypothetical protein
MTYNLFSPESHFRMIKTTMVVIAAAAIYEAMSMVQLTPNRALQLFVSFQLRSSLVARRGRDVVLTSPLLWLADGAFGLIVIVSSFFRTMSRE